MKKLITIIPLLLILILTGCSDSGLMEKLDGKWQTVMTESQGGETLDMTMVMTLDKAAGSGNIEMKVSTASVPEFFSVKVPVKKWSASGDELQLNLDDNGIQLTFSSAFKEMASLSKSNLPALEQEMKKEMKKEISTFTKTTIKDITADSLTITEDGSHVTFTRVK